jgi:sigma-E factor negative regulatory protein RseA
VSGQQVADLTMDISQRVRDALSQEGSAPSVSRLQNMIKPLASFAVAASVAAVVVVGGQQLSRVGDSGPYSAPFVRAGGVPVQASLGVQSIPNLQPATRTAYRELARQRMHKYMQEHAEHAALNSPQGLVPFARVQQIKE